MTSSVSPSTATSTSHHLQQLKELAQQRQLQVGILVFDNVEVLDFCGPFEVLSVTRLGVEGHDENVTTASPFDVRLIEHQTKKPIKTIGGMQVVPHVTMDHVMAAAAAAEAAVETTSTSTSPQTHKQNTQTHSSLDILILPGGMGTRTLRHDAKVLEFIRHQATRVKILASVCTGSILLGESGVLPAGTTITTHWKAIEMLQGLYPTLIVEKDRCVVKNDTGTLYTSAGISAGIDMCFCLVTDLFGEDVARATARRMEYKYPEDYQRRIDF